jgi:hypothetical protein
MKSRLHDDEAFNELFVQCHQVKLVATNGKLRETACADFLTMTALIRYLPMQYRCGSVITGAGSDLCRVYTILNNITQDQYCGSSINIAKRCAQDRSLLRRGRHYADRLQEAWRAVGESAFSMKVLEEVADPSYLVTAEQQHMDEKRPTYNNSKVATNLASSDPIPPSRIQQVMNMLDRANGGRAENFLFQAAQAALA